MLDNQSNEKKKTPLIAEILLGRRLYVISLQNNILDRMLFSFTNSVWGMMEVTHWMESNNTCTALTRQQREENNAASTERQRIMPSLQPLVFVQHERQRAPHAPPDLHAHSQTELSANARPCSPAFIFHAKGFTVV